MSTTNKKYKNNAPHPGIRSRVWKQGRGGVTSAPNLKLWAPCTARLRIEVTPPRPESEPEI